MKPSKISRSIKPGTLVRLTYRIPGIHRKDRRIVGKVIANELEMLVLSGRQEPNPYGTTECAWSWISDVEVLPDPKTSPR